MAWKRVKHPSEVVKVGDEIDVRILKFDRERSRVSLGLKQLGPGSRSHGARRG
jgi:small subunit ribosomal protein S1